MLLTRSHLRHAGACNSTSSQGAHKLLTLHHQRIAGTACNPIVCGAALDSKDAPIDTLQAPSSFSSPPSAAPSGSTSTTTTTTTTTSNSTSFLASEEATAVTALAASITVGVLLGSAGVGLDDSLPESARHLSSALGWAYFTAWSISFWPQIIDNHKTRDVSGLSADYLLFSLVGYVAYGAYTGALYFSDDVRASYAALHGSMPDVSASDFAFAAHAIVATLLVSGQYMRMKRPGDKGLSPFAAAVGMTVAAACGANAVHINATCDVGDCASWLPMLILLGGIKVLMTLIKYTPQVLHNHQRRSTEGWNLTNVLLDLSGGLLSFSQVALDAVARHDPSVITGNPAKLWIAALSIGYDLVFVAQHYWLYRGDKEGQEEGGVPEPVAVPVAAADGKREPRRGAVRAFAEAVRRGTRSAKKQA